MTSEPQPLIDFQRLNALLPDDIVWQCEFLQEYLVASQEQLEALQTHLTQQNASQLEYYAHKLKGISRMAAIREVPKLTEAIETLAPTQDFVAIAPIVAQLAVYLEQVHIEIQAYCDAQTPDSSRS